MTKGFSTHCLKNWKEPRFNAPHILPIYASSSFVFETLEEGEHIFRKEQQGHVYSRYANPTIDAVQTKLAELETWGSDIQATGYLTSSGMSAIYVLTQALLRPGDAIMAHRKLYGGTTELFQKVLQPHGIGLVSVDCSDMEAIRQAMTEYPGIKLWYLETPSNPTLDCLDLAQISALAGQYEVSTAVDNTFSTPYLQQPLLLGIDFVVHSTTKFLNGHGNSIAGVVIGKDTAFMQERLWPCLKLTGATCNAFDAWLLYNGLKTLPLRMERHCSNALSLARYLAEHPAVSAVNYPGLAGHPGYEITSRQTPRGAGALLSFDLAGGLPAARDCMNRLKLATMAPTLGDVDTLVMHPATSSHLNIDPEDRLREGVTDGLIRVSVGLEDIGDIIHDFTQALS